LRRLSIDEDENNLVNKKKVKVIIDHKYLKNKNWYLVQWNDGNCNSWEPEEALHSAHFSYSEYDEIILGRVETPIFKSGPTIE
ncbi:20138_t:CDS:2, partial [Gigaspora rosea]